MNITHVPRRIEIALWEVMISLLKNSPTAANLLLGCYQSLVRYRSIPYPLRIAAWGLLGLGIGFSLGLVFSPFLFGGI
jgi:hypothetical protein